MHFEGEHQDAQHLAATDPLTQLWNRREGERLVGVRIGGQSPFSLLVIDLNRFKLINDEYGHQCGDRVLEFVAARLSESIRPTDTVCRWGGDEFVVLLDCGSTSPDAVPCSSANKSKAIFCLKPEGRLERSQ